MPEWTIFYDPPGGTQRVEGPHTGGYLKVVAKDSYDRLLRIAGHLCVEPDEVGRSCGECLPCQLWEAARNAAFPPTEGPHE